MKTLITLLLIAISLSCSSAARFNSKQVEKFEKRNRAFFSSNETQIDTFYNLSNSVETVVGLASFYADDFDGKMTANGEIYNMYELTAAHKTYPFNTMIRVTNLANNKTVIVRINDRGPVLENRIIDLSLGAAIQLGMDKAGVQEVKLEIIEFGIN